VDDPWPDAFRNLGDAENHTSIVIDFDKVAILDSPFLGLLRVYANHHPVIPVLSDSVSWNVCKPFAVGIVVSMIGIAGMWSDQL
jgi:hypothetical protein